MLLKKCEKYSIERLTKLYCFDIEGYEDIYSNYKKRFFYFFTSFKIDEIKSLSMNIKELNLDE